MPFFTVSGEQLGLPPHGLTAFLGVEDDVDVFTILSSTTVPATSITSCT